MENNEMRNEMHNERNRIYLNVPFNEKEFVKKLGGLWDPEQKKWYIFDDNMYRFELIQKY
jgi:hypothetical protein